MGEQCGVALCGNSMIQGLPHKKALQNYVIVLYVILVVHIS
jgi:hypothetical protein